MKQGWEIKRLSEIGKVYNGNSINEKVKKDNYSDLDFGFPYIATKDISYKSEITYDNGIKIPFSEKSSFKIAPKNTVLICAEGGSAGRKIGFTNQEVCFGNKLFALATNNDIESRYVYYYYFSETFQNHFSVELAGIIGGVSMNKNVVVVIPTNTKDMLFSISPNPANDNFIFSLSNPNNQKCSVIISNSISQELKTLELGNQSNFNEQINVSNFSPGIYFVKTILGENTQVKKILIE